MFVFDASPISDVPVPARATMSGDLELARRLLTTVAIIA